VIETHEHAGEFREGIVKRSRPQVQRRCLLAMNLWVFMLDRSLALRLKTQTVAASSEDSSLVLFVFIAPSASGRMTMTLALFF